MPLAPLALGCGHVVTGFARFHWVLASDVEGEDLAQHSHVECPEGCGLQDWVSAPLLAEEVEEPLEAPGPTVGEQHFRHAAGMPAASELPGAYARRCPHCYLLTNLLAADGVCEFCGDDLQGLPG